MASGARHRHLYRRRRQALVAALALGVAVSVLGRFLYDREAIGPRNYLALRLWTAGIVASVALHCFAVASLVDSLRSRPRPRPPRDRYREYTIRDFMP